MVPTVIERIVTHLLDAAVRRWPDHAREELIREWTAEVHALGRDHDVAGPVRRWRQLRFAASLVLARQPEAALPWPGRPSPARAHVAWLVAAPLLTMLAAPPLLLAVQLPLAWLTLTPTLITVLAVETLVATAGVAAIIGTVLARRLVRRRAGASLGVAAAAGLTLPMIGGLLVLDGLARAVNGMWAGGASALVAALCLVATLPPVAAGIAALARGRPGLAVAVAGLASPAVTLTALYVAVLMARPVPTDAASGPWWWLIRIGQEPILNVWYDRAGTGLPIEAVLKVLPGAVLATVVLGLAHAIRSARPAPAATSESVHATSESVHAPGVPSIARSPWWHRIALAGGAYSVVAWAVTLTYLTPHIGGADAWPGWTTEESRLWMQELQVSAIVCAALCLLCAAAYRGRPVGPTVVGAAALVAVDMAVVRQGWTTSRLLPWLVAGGLIVGIAAWLASTRRLRPAHRPQRLVITIAVLAAFLVPGSFFPRFYVVEGVQAPPVLLLVAVGLPTVLTLLAAMGVLATTRRARPGPAWRRPVVLASLVAVGGVLLYQDGLIPFPTGDHPLGLLVFMGPLALAVPVAAWTIIAIHGRPARRGLHVLLAPPLLVGGLVVGLVAAVATVVAATALARLVLFPMEYGQTFDGLAYLPGAVVVGLAIGHLAAVRLDRGRPDAAPALGTVGFV
jgi:hypothetical protein